MRGTAWGLAAGLMLSCTTTAPARAACPVEEDSRVKPYGQVSPADFNGRRQQDRRQGAQIATSLRLIWGEAAVSRGPDGRWLASSVGLCVAALMHKGQSAMARDGRIGLAHEQVHFSITEYFARALTAQLRSRPVPGRSAEAAWERLESRVASSYQKGVAEWREMQFRYDDETRNGTQPRAQRRWERQIQRLLDQLSVEP